jgi:hypothetical protein
VRTYSERRRMVCMYVQWEIPDSLYDRCYHEAELIAAGLADPDQPLPGHTEFDRRVDRQMILLFGEGGKP